jgi:hypothetical protein
MVIGAHGRNGMDTSCLGAYAAVHVNAWCLHEQPLGAWFKANEGSPQVPMVAAALLTAILSNALMPDPKG